ncbi:MAG: hypothetical protein ACYS76_04525 [Planctomycetota bacterium]|jgi:hypothetical protein
MATDEKKLGKHTEAMAGRFLFEPGDLNDSQFLDMRTRIKSEKAMNALLHYGILGEVMKCDEATMIGDMIKRLFIANDGQGRAEGVEVLRQNFPKKVEIAKGVERIEFDKDT